MKPLSREAVRDSIARLYESYVMDKLAPVIIDHFTDYAMTLLIRHNTKEAIAKLGLYIDLFVETWEPQPPYITVSGGTPPTITTLPGTNLTGTLYNRPGSV